MLPVFLGDVGGMIAHNLKFFYHTINFLRSCKEVPEKEVVRYPPGSLWYC